ncbi:MAG TPA: alpha/beta hydrolase [Candidatus Pseudogracilibacillus intestinigallinarum]|uniref:Alpha/beta hydrolase n=1 Tax=Candidatus Pseudogracilibacillus intestinigallinarum TaxID=2838742 RepID=A0A9D1PKU5_9BACI|nr:alpha/beta hydrolase [Candidatus Pseudogracilibacillus intestinigallinarum]
MKRKKWLKIIISLISCLFIVDVLAGFYFYHLAIERGPKEFLQNNSDLEVADETMDTFLKGEWIKWKDEQPFVEMTMESDDGITLQGYYLAQEEESDKTVIFGHGYLGNALQMSLYGKYYYEELGYNLFMPNFRGHGKSEGDYYGFGWHDRLDMIKWIETLEGTYGKKQIVLHGLSMGAATVLMVSGEDVPDEIKAIIADSPYTSVYDLFGYQMTRMFHLPKEPILTTTSIVTKLRANYSLREASALKQVKKATVPILYIVGEADTFVPAEMTDVLFEATSSEKELVTFPKANHGEAGVMYEAKFMATVTEFLHKYVEE